MRLFSYRNRTRFAKIALIVLGVLAALLALSLIILAYFDRYIVYDQNGAHLDPNWQENSESITVLTPSVDAEISYLEDEDVAIGTTRQVTGYYVTADMLQNLDALEQTLSDSSIYAVLFDMKNDYGTRYYPTRQSNAPSSSVVDVEAAAELISELSDRDIYLIARIPAFVDYTYCLNHTDLGLPVSSGALWSDENGNFWMDPADSNTISYLEQTCIELQELGFEEVVLDRFRFPNTTSIVYDETERTKEEIIINTAQTLQSNLSALDLKVSFGISTDTAFPYLLTSGSLYFSVNSGSDLESIASVQAESVANAATQLIFLTEPGNQSVADYSHLYPAPVQAAGTE